MIVPEPPHPFLPEIEILDAGARVFRVHGNARGPAEFNDSGRGSTRFAFFSGQNIDSAIPVLYAAESEGAAVAETMLHDVPVTGGILVAEQYRSRVLNRLVTNRSLRLAAFHGLGLRRLRIEATQLTDTDRSEYPQTVKWAQAAHRFEDSRGSLDGIVWMSKRCNSDRAYVFFGDRVDAGAFDVDTGFGRVFADSEGMAWLSDLCAPLGVDVLNP